MNFQYLVNFQNLVKLGEFTGFSPGFHQTKTKKRFAPPNFTKKEAFFHFFCEFYAFYGEIWVEFGEIPKPGENLVKTW